MADVASSINSWSITESSNSPSGTTVIGVGLDDNLRQIQATVRTLCASASVASSTADPLSSTENTFVTITHSTGTTAITDLGNRAEGVYRYVTFSISGGTLSLTHNATTLILPGAANITCATRDTAMFVSTGTDSWKCLWYCRDHVPYKLTSTAASALAASASAGSGTEAARSDHAHQRQLESFVIAMGDETTSITTGLKVTFRMPYAFTVTEVKGSLTTASSSGSVIYDIHEGTSGGTSIMTTNKITIEANELTSKDATTQPTVTDTALASDAEMTLYVDSAGTGAKGPKVVIIGRQSA